MRSHYFKHGSGVRLEVRGRERGEIVFREGGEAWEEKGAFFCRSIAFDGETTGAVDLPGRLWTLLEDLPVTVERATLVLGVSLHRYEEGGVSTSWGEETARLHLALANRLSGVRCVVERGGATGSDLWLDEIARIARALEKAEARPVVSRTPIVLDPDITAAIVSALVLSGGPFPTDPPLAQSPRPNERDGCGRPVEPRPIARAGILPAGTRTRSPEWDSVYRPSYRTRPVPLPFGVDLDREFVGAIEGKARAIALSGEIELTRRALRIPLLIEDEGHVGESIVELRRELLDRAIVAVGRARSWYPYLAGVWGRELLLDPSRLT